MQKLKKGLCGVVSLMLVVSLLAGCGDKTKPADTTTSAEVSTSTTTEESTMPKEKVEIRVLDCWNGSSSDAPADMENNAVAKKILEKTNVVFKFDYATTKETEKLNMLFSASDIPYDLILAPYWGGDGDECGAIKKAGSQGLLKPLEDLIGKYGENIKPALTTNLKASFIEQELNIPGYNGHTYVVPYETHSTDQDYRNEGMGLYARKDIMDSLGWKQEDFNSSDKVAEYLKAVKAGNFKDAIGKAVIPAGTWANGWEVLQFAKSYKDNSQSGMYTLDGKTFAFHRGPLFEKQVLFVRQLVADGLFDVEAFSQNDTLAKEKMAVGKYAVVPAHFFHMRDNLGNTLYKTNAEMKYVPIGPIPNADGVIGEKRMMSKGGSPVWFIPASTSDDVAKAAIYAINYLNSAEGKLLPFYGVEGTHFDKVDGKPRMKDEFVAKAQGGTLAKETGIQGCYRKFVSLRPYISEWGEFTPGDSKSLDESYSFAITKMNPFIQSNDGRDVWAVARKEFKEADPATFEKIEKIWWGQLWPDLDDKYRKRAYLCKTEDEAMKILQDFQKKLLDTGVEKLEDFVTKHREDLKILF